MPKFRARGHNNVYARRAEKERKHHDGVDGVHNPEVKEETAEIGDGADAVVVIMDKPRFVRISPARSAH